MAATRRRHSSGTPALVRGRGLGRTHARDHGLWLTRWFARRRNTTPERDHTVYQFVAPLDSACLVFVYKRYKPNDTEAFENPKDFHDDENL